MQCPIKFFTIVDFENIHKIVIDSRNLLKNQNCVLIVEKCKCDKNR